MTVAMCNNCNERRWVDHEDEHNGRQWCSTDCMWDDLEAAGEVVVVSERWVTE